MKTYNQTFLFLLLLFSFSIKEISPLEAQQLDEIILPSKDLWGDARGEHPRGLIQKEEVKFIRERAKTNAFLKVRQKIEQEERSLAKQVRSAEILQAQVLTELAANQSYLFLITGEKKWAEKALVNLTEVFKDTVIFNNPVSRGLTRAAVLQKMAVTYDFCYEAWTQDKRNLVNRQLYKLIYSTNANMGYDANYSLVSNWMGVRWGSVLFASFVWDNPTPSKPSLVQPLLWDVQKRLSDHLEQNVYPEGWSAESIGYHIYNWSFIGPALIAFQNQQQKESPGAIQELAPQLENSIKGIASAVLSIETSRGRWGMKPDLSDDGLNLGDGLFSLAFRLYPPTQIPFIKWMHDYVKEAHFYSLLYYPDTIQSNNPKNAGWLNFSDSTQGVVSFRNEFEDESDIVAVFNTSDRRVAGHKGPDVNTFRILGFGVPWIIGAGRTNLVAGQSNLFPGPVSPSDKGDLKKSGKLIHYSFLEEGSGEAVGLGSSTGVDEHRRKFIVDYTSETAAAAVFLIVDSSENGKIWRINTPEFIHVTMQSGRFRLTAPNGASLQAHFFSERGQVAAHTGQVRYGGETVRLNTGILFQGERYAFSNYIDLVVDKEVVVVMTLQPKDKQHPVPRWDSRSKMVKIAQKEYDISLRTQ